MPATSLTAPFAGTVLVVPVAAGDHVRSGQVVALIESMKMEHEVHAPHGGLVHAVAVAAGDTVAPGDVLLDIEAHAEAPDRAPAAPGAPAVDTGGERPELAELRARRAR
ncbi:MAG TPA: acetyl-CoA carboxylase biotin carboxyl carrier protein subunit, partial [Acidimicrobiales bacterium]|nr:acetyl-CoA carboxylase biotin carboxyl carrier protein subunit [Acidimicrobiales bacterium]